MKIKNGTIQVKVRDQAPFGKYCDLTDKLPAECNCIMVLLNTGGGLNAGFPKPIGFMKLTHQLYVKNLEKLIEEHINQAPFADKDLMWISIVPIRSDEIFDVWKRNGAP